MATPNHDALRCPGCGNRPVETTSFGRYKLVCPLFHGRHPDTTHDCINDNLYPWSLSVASAVDMWNSEVL